MACVSATQVHVNQNIKGTRIFRHYFKYDNMCRLMQVHLDILIRAFSNEDVGLTKVSGVLRALRNASKSIS